MTLNLLDRPRRSRSDPYRWRRLFVDRLLEPAKRFGRRLGLKLNTFTFVQTANSSSDGDSATLAVTLTGVGAGNLVVLWFKHEGASTGLTTTGDGTLSEGTYFSHSNNDLHGQFFYKLSSTGGNTTYTVTLDASRPWKRLIAMEFSYADTCVFDVQNTGVGTSSAISSGNVTTTGTEEICLGGSGEYSNQSISSMLINGVAADGSVNPNDYFAMWRRRTTATFTGAATATISGSDWICAIICFKEAGAPPAGGPVKGSLALSGVGI